MTADITSTSAAAFDGPSATVPNLHSLDGRDLIGQLDRLFWEAIWAELQMALRERMGREASPSAAVLDSQSVKSAEKGR